MESCVLSSLQGQGCTITQPAGDGLRVKRVLHCSTLSLMLEWRAARSLLDRLLIGYCTFLRHAIINMVSESLQVIEAIIGIIYLGS